MAEFGRIITESEAHDYVELCKVYRNSLINGILPPHLAGPEGDLKTCAMYYNDKTNVWVFDAELVLNLFKDNPGAKYFGVFLGATQDMKSIVVGAALTNGMMSTAKQIEQPKFGKDQIFPKDGPITVIDL